MWKGWVLADTVIWGGGAASSRDIYVASRRGGAACWESRFPSVRLATPLFMNMCTNRSMHQQMKLHTLPFVHGVSFHNFSACWPKCTCCFPPRIVRGDHLWYDSTVTLKLSRWCAMVQPRLCCLLLAISLIPKCSCNGGGIGWNYYNIRTS